MEKRISRAVMTALLFCAVLSAFYLRADGDRPVSAIPVEKVFSRVKSTQAPTGWRDQRDARRREEIDALTQLAAEDEAAANELKMLLERAENELAIENALAALGQERAVCAIRRNAVTVCLRERLPAEKAAAVIELAARIAGVETENVLVLDECAYL